MRWIEDLVLTHYEATEEVLNLETVEKTDIDEEIVRRNWCDFDLYRARDGLCGLENGTSDRTV